MGCSNIVHNVTATHDFILNIRGEISRSDDQISRSPGATFNQSVNQSINQTKLIRFTFITSNRAGLAIQSQQQLELKFVQ